VHVARMATLWGALAGAIPQVTVNTVAEAGGTPKATRKLHWGYRHGDITQCRR